MKINIYIYTHQKPLQFLMTEIYRIKNNQAPPIMYHLFQLRKTLSM